MCTPVACARVRTHQCVCRLARLRDSNHHVVVVQDRPAVAELGRVLHLWCGRCDVQAWRAGMACRHGAQLWCEHARGGEPPTSTGMRANVSMRYSPSIPACHEVPHATIRMRFALQMRSRWAVIPAICSTGGGRGERGERGETRRGGANAAGAQSPATSPPACMYAHIRAPPLVGRWGGVGTCITPSSASSRPRIQFSSTSGCSIISLSMKCLYEPF